MNIAVGIVGLPNVGPIQSLLALEVYILASQEHLYGTTLLEMNPVIRGGLVA
jgi:hypothetical protein